MEVCLFVATPMTATSDAFACAAIHRVYHACLAVVSFPIAAWVVYLDPGFKEGSVAALFCSPTACLAEVLLVVYVYLKLPQLRCPPHGCKSFPGMLRFCLVHVSRRLKCKVANKKFSDSKEAVAEQSANAI